MLIPKSLISFVIGASQSVFGFPTRVNDLSRYQILTYLAESCNTHSISLVLDTQMKKETK